MSESSDYARLITDKLVGMRVPRDDEPAYIIRCLYGPQTSKRYFFSMASVSVGPITVARQHAHRFPTRDEAMVKVRELRDRTIKTTWRLVRLRTSQPSSTSQTKKDENSNGR